jgi:hypothetical protein
MNKMLHIAGSSKLGKLITGLVAGYLGTNWTLVAGYLGGN